VTSYRVESNAVTCEAVKSGHYNRRSNGSMGDSTNHMEIHGIPRGPWYTRVLSETYPFL